MHRNDPFRAGYHCILLCLVLLATDLLAADLNQGWQYRWGDSPFQQSTPQWTLPEEAAADEWQAISFPSNPPERQGQQHAWYRIILPEGEWVDPVLYIYSIDLIAEAYLGTELIYRFGTFDDQGRGHFIGWPWHQIELPKGFAGQTLHFRVYSDYTDIGLWGEVKIMERSELLLFILKRSITDLLIATFCIFIALLALAFVPLQKGNHQFLYLALFALASAGKLLGENQAVQLLVDAPLLRTYLAAAAYFSMPIFISLLLTAWFDKKNHKHHQLLYGTAYLHLAYLLLALGASLAGVIHLSITYPVFDALFAISLLVLLFTISRNLRHLSQNQRLVMFAFGVFALLLLIDMAVAHGFLPWRRIPLSLGALTFALVLVIISLRSYNTLQETLHQLNLTLEQRVSERTAALHHYAQQERDRSKLLGVINQHSHKLDTLIDQLQHCPSLQEAGVLLNHELPKIFKPALVQVQLLESSGPAEKEATINNMTHADPTENLLVQVIHVTQLQGGQYPFLRCELLPSEHLSESSRNLLTGFMQRLSDRISVTLSSILLRESLQQMSYEDALTGLKNRRFLDESLHRESQLAQRHQTPLSLLICDIDHFKQFNDRYGHHAGDMALRAVASILLEHFRETDLPCRFGGEEFVVVMPGATHAAAQQRAEALRKKVAERALSYQGRELGYVTVSVGIACWPDTCSTLDLLMTEADKALYRAKQQGRNRVESSALAPSI